MNDRYILLFSFCAACVIHAVALSQGFAVAEAVTGDLRPRLRSFIVAPQQSFFGICNSTELSFGSGVDATAIVLVDL